MGAWANGLSIDYTFYETPLKHKTYTENVSSFVDYSIYKNANFFLKMEILNLLCAKRKYFRLEDIIKHLKKVIAGMRQWKKRLYKNINIPMVADCFMRQLRRHNFIHCKLIKQDFPDFYLYKYKDNFDEFFNLDLINNKQFVRYIEKNFQAVTIRTFFKLNIVLSYIKQYQPVSIQEIHKNCKIYNKSCQYHFVLLPTLKNSGVIVMDVINRNKVFYSINGDLDYE